MNSEEDSNEFLDSITKCVFCHFSFINKKEDLQKSKFLECFHIICATCHSLWTFNEVKTCPECQIRVTKCDLLDTKIVQEVVFIQKEFFDNGAAIFCGMHKDRRANRWCEDCSEFVCHECEEKHGQLKITLSHVIKPIKDSRLVIGGRPEKCNIHPNEELVIFCSTCEKVTCRDCQLSDHCMHNHKLVNEVIDSTKRELFQKNHALKYHLIILEKASKIMETQRHNLLQQEENAKMKITNCFNQIVDALEKKKHKVLSNLDCVVEKQIVALDSKQQSIGEMSNKVKHTTSLTSHVLNHSSDSSILHSKKHLVQWLYSVESNEVMVPNPKSHIELDFVSNAENIINAITNMEDLGRISLAQNLEENMQEFCVDVEKLHSGTGMQPQGIQNEDDTTSETSSSDKTNSSSNMETNCSSDSAIPGAGESSPLSGTDFLNIQDDSTQELIIQTPQSIVAAENEVLIGSDFSTSAEAIWSKSSDEERAGRPSTSIKQSCSQKLGAIHTSDDESLSSRGTSQQKGLFLNALSLGEKQSIQKLKNLEITSTNASIKVYSSKMISDTSVSDLSSAVLLPNRIVNNQNIEDNHEVLNEETVQPTSKSFSNNNTSQVNAKANSELVEYVRRPLLSEGETSTGVKRSIQPYLNDYPSKNSDDKTIKRQRLTSVITTPKKTSRPNHSMTPKSPKDLPSYKMVPREPNVRIPLYNPIARFLDTAINQNLNELKNQNIQHIEVSRQRVSHGRTVGLDKESITPGEQNTEMNHHKTPIEILPNPPRIPPNFSTGRMKRKTIEADKPNS